MIKLGKKDRSHNTEEAVAATGTFPIDRIGMHREIMLLFLDVLFK